jgi:hypothetical protein
MATTAAASRASLGSSCGFSRSEILGLKAGHSFRGVQLSVVRASKPSQRGQKSGIRAVAAAEVAKSSSVAPDRIK